MPRSAYSLTPNDVFKRKSDDCWHRKKHFEIPEVTNVEVKIFLNRLIGIFEILMKKLEFVATLPLILSHTKALNVLNKCEFKQVEAAFAPFSYFQQDTEQTLTLLQSIDTSFQKEEQFSTESAPENEDECSCHYTSEESSCDTVKDNPTIYNAIEILSSYPSIRKLSRSKQADISVPALNFLRQVMYFMEFVVSKAKLLPSDEREKELSLRRVLAEIERSRSEITELTASLAEQKLRHQAEHAEVSCWLEEARETWQKINEDFDNEIAKTLKDSEDNLAKSFEEFTERMNHHQEALENLKEQVEKDKEKNVKLEKEFLGKKFKVESQLLSLLMKFDTEIAERQEEFNEIMMDYEVVETDRVQLMEEMEEQRELHDGIIREREEKAFGEFREKYEKFVRNRCAKLIQRWWRKVLKKRRKKKKKKRGKKKK